MKINDVSFSINDLNQTSAHNDHLRLGIEINDFE